MRRHAGLWVATAAMVVVGWLPLIIGMGGGKWAPALQTAVYLALAVLTIYRPHSKVLLVRTVQRRVLNPLVRVLFSFGVNPLGLVLLETRGRVSGRPRRVPVGNGRSGSDLWIIAEHGLRAGYVRNIMADPCVRVRIRIGWRIRWVEGFARIRPDDDVLERQRLICAGHPLRTLNALNVQTLGADLLCVHVALDLSGNAEPAKPALLSGV